MLDRVHHIAIAVRDLERTVASWEQLGVQVTRLDHSAKNVQLATFRVGDTIFELVSPTGPGTLQEVLDTRGEGVYHVAFEVGDINGRLRELEGRGVPLRDREARDGIAWKVAWLDVTERCGLPCQLIELDSTVDPERLATALGFQPGAPVPAVTPPRAQPEDWRPRPVRGNGLRPVSGFEPAIRSGPLVFISGQVAVDANGNLVGKGDIAAQCDQVYANLKAAVEAAGGSMSDIVRLVTYTLSRDHRVAIREARARWFQGDVLPTSTLVVVSGLADSDYLMEIEATAVIPSL